MTRSLARSLGLTCLLFGLAAPADEIKKDEAKAPPAPPVVVDIVLTGSLTEGPSPVGLDGEPIGDNLKTTVDKILKAKDDAAVKAMMPGSKPL